MLSEDDQQKIRSEEIFRREVRKQLDEERGNLGAWHYLNSPLAIWFFSSIILTLVTTGWTWTHSRLTNERRDKEKRIALAYEISVRSTDFLKKCDRAESPDEFWAAFSTLEGPQYRLVQFRDATMDELVYQFRLLPKDTDHSVADHLDDAFTAIEDLLSEGSGESGTVNYYLKKIVEEKINGVVRENVGVGGQTGK